MLRQSACVMMTEKLALGADDIPDRIGSPEAEAGGANQQSDWPGRAGPGRDGVLVTFYSSRQRSMLVYRVAALLATKTKR